MKRLLPLLGAVLVLALSSTASADTFRVVHPHGTGPGPVTFTTDVSPAALDQAQKGPMSFPALRTIWQAAGSTYGIPWEVLAAINKIETNFGRNLGPSSAGAVGWMQFMPSTWARWGVDANHDGVADPDNPTDAIFSAARYLAGCGGQLDIARAVYCYNHATWYVNEVLGLAAQYANGGGAGLFSVDQVQSRLDSASARIRSANRQLVKAVAQVRKLASAERRSLRTAAKIPLLSGQLEAHKHAVLIGVRRERAESRVARLRRVLHSATAALNRAQEQATSLPLAGTTVGIGGLQFERIDQGVDYVSSTPYQAFASGTVVHIDPNFWQGTPAVYEKLDSPISVGGHVYDEIYYAETPSLVHTGQRLLPGQAVIGPGAAEIGFAKDELPAAHSIYHEGDQTPAGHDFYAYATAGNPGGASSPARFFLVSPAAGFQPGAGSTSFTSDVVYFTH
ncbi:MAG TPA: lytic murein transglycosylase [Gaiellaceae bacterium]|nr:lytic murein transglycosylase [Gaiellaceae bacterium]